MRPGRAAPTPPRRYRRRTRWLRRRYRPGRPALRPPAREAAPVTPTGFGGLSRMPATATNPPLSGGVGVRLGVAVTRGRRPAARPSRPRLSVSALARSGRPALGSCHSPTCSPLPLRGPTVGLRVPVPLPCPRASESPSASGWAAPDRMVTGVDCPTPPVESCGHVRRVVAGRAVRVRDRWAVQSSVPCPSPKCHSYEGVPCAGFASDALNATLPPTATDVRAAWILGCKTSPTTVMSMSSSPPSAVLSAS